MRRVGIGLFVLGVLGGGVFACVAVAGLPGYFEWVLWEETESVGAGASPTEPPRTFRWVVGPYSRRTLRQGAGLAARLLCLPDTVNPREDPRWQ
jgi:hypothetical protein